MAPNPPPSPSKDAAAAPNMNDAQPEKIKATKPSAIPKPAAAKRTKRQSAAAQPTTAETASTETKQPVNTQPASSSVTKQRGKSNPAQSQANGGYSRPLAWQVPKLAGDNKPIYDNRRNRQQHHTKLESARKLAQAAAVTAQGTVGDTSVASETGQGPQPVQRTFNFVLDGYSGEGMKTTTRRVKRPAESSSSPKEPAPSTSGAKASTSKKGPAASLKHVDRMISQTGPATDDSSVVHSGVTLGQQLPPGFAVPTFSPPGSDLPLPMPIPVDVHEASHIDRDETGQRASKSLRYSPERDFTDEDNRVIRDFNSADPRKLIASSMKASSSKRATGTQTVDLEGVAGPSNRPASPFEPHHSVQAAISTDVALLSTNGENSNVQISAEDLAGANAVFDVIRDSALSSSSPTQEATNNASDFSPEYSHEFRSALVTAAALTSGSQAQGEENGIFTHQGAVESTDSLATSGSESSFGPSTPPDRVLDEFPSLATSKDKGRPAAASSESVDLFP